ncbi:MAG: hypothetical protein MZW92_26225 [Comamonadaceae bacterium]|nr:hypothetical protein [Comamonadaceae bacterium]
MTEAVWVLGGGDRLVGLDRYSTWPAQLSRLPRVGGMEDAAVEAGRRAAARPGAGLGHRARSAGPEDGGAGAARAARLRADSHADIHALLRTLGRVLGREAAAERASARIEAELAAAAARGPRRPCTGGASSSRSTAWAVGSGRRLVRRRDAVAARPRQRRAECRWGRFRS